MFVREGGRQEDTFQSASEGRSDRTMATPQPVFVQPVQVQPSNEVVTIGGGQPVVVQPVVVQPVQSQPAAIVSGTSRQITRKLQRDELRQRFGGP